MKTTLALLLLIATCTSLSLQQSEGHFLQEGSTIKLNQWQLLTLSVDVAARQGPGSISTYPLNRAMLRILWNGETVEDWRVTDYSLRTLTFKVKPVQGVNILQFKAPQYAMAFSSLDNVKLTSRFISENLIVNGQFENIQFSSQGWNAYDSVNRIPGWRTEKRYVVGPAKIFSPEFSTNHVTLDNNYPHMYQVFRFDLISEKDL